MPQTKSTLRMTKTVTRVKVNSASTGSGVYEVADLEHSVPIDVLGEMLYDHGDGSATPCFMVINKNGTLVARAMRLFEVLDWKDE